MPGKYNRSVVQSAEYGIRVADEVEQAVRAAGPDVAGSAVSSKIGRKHVKTALAEAARNKLPTGPLVKYSVQANEQRSVRRSP